MGGGATDRSIGINAMEGVKVIYEPHNTNGAEALIGGDIVSNFSFRLFPSRELFRVKSLLRAESLFSQDGFQW